MSADTALDSKDLKKKGIRTVYNPDQDEKDVVRKVYDRKRAMEEAEMRQKAQAMWNKADDAWEALRKDRDEKRDEWQSNHYVPLTQSIIETAMSEFVGQMPRPYVMARGSEDEPKTMVAQKMFDYSLECSDFDLNEFDVMHDGLRRGTAIAQEYYWQERRIVQNEEVQKGKTKLVEEEVVDYDDLYLENVKLEDFFVDENARDFKGTYAAKDCVRRYIMDIDDFKQMFSGDIWDPLSNAKYVKPGGDVNYYEWYQPPQGMDTSKQVEVLWYWAIKPKDWWIIVANDVLIFKKPIPFKHKRLPFVRSVAVRRSHSFYGKGLAEILESTQDEQNTLRRMIIDRNHLDIDKMFFVSNKLALSDEDLIARPHGMIPTDDVNASRAIEYGDIPRSVELSLKHLEDDATISTGVNPRAQALPQAGTATEASILKESTLKRLQLIVWLHKYGFIIDFARLRMSNIVQFYQQPRLEKIVGEAATAEFQKEKANLQAKGLVTTIDGQDYRKQYRQIRLENKQIGFDATGQPQEQGATGTTFFEALPKYFVPQNKLGYDFKFLPGAMLQISKPLQQQKDLEWADRMLMIAQTVPNSYDPIKIGDVITRAYDKDPNSIKIDNPQQDQQQQRDAMLLQMAQMENQEMMKGKEVPPTPFATPPHTTAHIQQMQSPQFQQLPNESSIIQIFTNHITGEIAAQLGRGGQLGIGGGQPGQVPVQGQPAPGQQPPQPGLGQPGQTNPVSISQGIQNRPGGMAKPATKLSDVMPNFNPGNKNASI